MSGPDPRRGRRVRASLTAQIDPLTGWARLPDGELLPPGGQLLSTAVGPDGLLRLRRLAPSDLTAHDQGREARLPGAALRHLLDVVDGRCCRFPGCTRRRNLHAHHVQYWASGGRTDLANLVLVCSRHHTLIHQDGYLLTLTPARRLTVRTAAGVHIPRNPAAGHRATGAGGRGAGSRDDSAGMPQFPAVELPLVADVALTPESYSRMNLAYAVSVLIRTAA